MKASRELDALVAEIVERGLQRKFVDALIGAVGHKAYVLGQSFETHVDIDWHEHKKHRVSAYDTLWALIHATHEQRIEAAMKTLKIKLEART